MQLSPLVGHTMRCNNTMRSCEGGFQATLLQQSTSLRPGNRFLHAAESSARTAMKLTEMVALLEELALKKVQG